MKKRRGRPKSKPSLPEGWQEDLLELYENGASDVEVKAWIHEVRGSFSNDLWDRWLKVEKQFSETIKIGRLKSNAWWERQGRISLKTPGFNYVGWYMNMKNRFDWTDRQEINQNVNDSRKSVAEIFPTDDEIENN